MVARRRTNHTALALLFRQVAEFIQRPAKLVRSAFLKNLRLQPDVKTGVLAQQPRRKQWRVISERRNYFSRGLKLCERNFRSKGNLCRHGLVLSIRFEEALS